jgi:hypothetical protein
MLSFFDDLEDVADEAEDLLDALLREGMVIEADVIVTVADVPLVGINLRAAVAGMTTMVEYGALGERFTATPETASCRGPRSGGW